jgi:hypothetical protein
MVCIAAIGYDPQTFNSELDSIERIFNSLEKIEQHLSQASSKFFLRIIHYHTQDWKPHFGSP